MAEEHTDSQSVLLQQVIADIQTTLQLRNAFHIRVARKVTILLRVGLVSLGVLAIILLLLLTALSSQTQSLITIVGTMNQRFVSMSDNMYTMRNTIERMEKSVATMPIITGEVTRMRHTVTAMSGELTGMDKRLIGIHRQVAGIENNMAHMTMTFGMLDRGVQGMGVDVHRMSRPMKTFNSISPLP
ncbi:MAG: hypothetical protein G8345_11040 [Magnetococcales bacterium]|nr:hypothetical protein [Magnetococcales bacterium]NGZ27408.1 hypothetical protein [Magnetococcales bacterium]